MNTVLKCLLLDDELPGLTYLKMLCEQIPELEVVKAFNNPENLLAEIYELDFDLCILDVEMPQMNGMQVANLLNDKLIIFTTAYKEFAVEAFDLNAVDYICKPLQKERLEQAVRKAVKRMNSVKESRNFIKLNTDKGKALIYFEQIGFIRTSAGDSRDKIAFLKDNTQICLKNISFDKLLALLPRQQFRRINKREIISLSIIQVFTFDEITTNYLSESNRALVLTLSDTYRNDFLEGLKG